MIPPAGAEPREHATTVASARSDAGVSGSTTAAATAHPEYQEAYDDEDDSSNGDTGNGASCQSAAG